MYLLVFFVLPELPLHIFIKDEVTVEDLKPLNQDLSHNVKEPEPQNPMSLAELQKESVLGRLEAAAEEIFVAFHRVIINYEEELERHRKLFDATWKPAVKLHRKG